MYGLVSGHKFAVIGLIEISLLLCVPILADLSGGHFTAGAAGHWRRRGLCFSDLL
jgi:hypothetical protein